MAHSPGPHTAFTALSRTDLHFPSTESHAVFKDFLNPCTIICRHPLNLIFCKSEITAVFVVYDGIDHQIIETAENTLPGNPQQNNSNFFEIIHSIFGTIYLLENSTNRPFLPLARPFSLCYDRCNYSEPCRLINTKIVFVNRLSKITLHINNKEDST